MTRTTVIRLAACAAAGAIAAGIFVPPAHADPVADSVYLSGLDDAGVRYSSERDAIRTGHTVCDSIAAQPSAATVLTMYRTAIGNGFTDDQAAAIVGGAMGAYCHEYRYLLLQTPSPSRGSLTTGSVI